MLRLSHMMLWNVQFCCAIKFATCGVSDFLAAGQKHVTGTWQTVPHAINLWVESTHCRPQSNHCRGFSPLHRLVSWKEIKQNHCLFNSNVFCSLVCLCYGNSRNGKTVYPFSWSLNPSPLHTIFSVQGKSRSKWHLFKLTCSKKKITSTNTSGD